MKESLAQDLLRELQHIVDRPIRIMVVCGTHNRAIMRYDLRRKLPENLDLVAGPGCSVCVMPAGHIDAFVRIAMQPDVITVTCDDLLQVIGHREESVPYVGRIAERDVITRWRGIGYLTKLLDEESRAPEGGRLTPDVVE